MESDLHLLYFTKLSGKSRDFYFLVWIHLNAVVRASYLTMKVISWWDDILILKRSIGDMPTCLFMAALLRSTLRGYFIWFCLFVVEDRLLSSNGTFWYVCDHSPKSNIEGHRCQHRQLYVYWPLPFEWRKRTLHIFIGHFGFNGLGTEDYGNLDNCKFGYLFIEI